MQSVDFELRPGVFVRDFERQSAYLAPQMSKTYLKVPKLAAIMILQQICQVSLGGVPPRLVCSRLSASPLILWHFREFLNSLAGSQDICEFIKKHNFWIILKMDGDITCVVFERFAKFPKIDNFVR